MKPKELVMQWVDAFNKADADGLTSFCSEHAVNHQMAESPVEGKAAIRSGCGDMASFTYKTT